MKWLSRPISQSWFRAFIIILAAIVAVRSVSCQRPRVDTFHSLWRAGRISNPSANDIWIEYNVHDYRVISIYRDFDGDGYVDECLFVYGPTLAVYRASGKDGVLDTVREIWKPFEAAEQIPRDSPEAGPWTREKLDEEVRSHPRDPELVKQLISEGRL